MTPSPKRYTERYHLLLRPEERQAFEEAAERAGLNLAAWMRTRLLRAAESEATRAEERRRRHG